jgi:glycosyltransferase involved in cell wall biosynthesis
MRYSVIIPAYNAQDYIEQSVDSILSQTDGDFEILIADDGSKDATKKIIDAMLDERIKKHHNDKNLGYLQTCNKLMSLAKGEFIVFQDADDVSLPTRLEEQYRFITENNLDACGTWVQRIDSHGNNSTLIQYPININEGLAEGKFNFVAGTFMVHRYLIDSVGLYHSYFDRIGFEDYYWTLLIAFNFRIQNLPLPLYMYRENFESVSNNFSTLDKEFSFRSVLYLLNQKLAGLTDYLEENKEKKLKEEVLKIMLSSRLDNRNSLNNQEVKKLSNDLLKNNPFSLLNWKIALKQALI